MAKKNTKSTSSKKSTTTKKVEVKETPKKVVEKVEVKEQPKEVKETPKKVETKTETKVVKTKKESKKSFIETAKENPYLIVLCVICVLLIINIVIVVIGHQAKLKDGEEIIASIEGKDYTAEELFNNLKDSNGSTALINMIDEYIVSKEITSDDDAKKYAEEQVASIKKQYESYGYDWSDTLTQYGYNSEDALLKEIMASYKKELVVKKYLKEKLTDEEIQKYYDDEVYGDYTAKHILITPDTTDDMTDDEKTAAEEAAKAKAQEVIEKLNNGEDWATLVSEYSEDEGSKDNEGLVENFTKGDVADEFFDAVLKLENGKYTTEPVKSSYGYHVILKISNTEKSKLDDVKDDIIDKIVENKLSDDDKLYDTTWSSIRESYKLTINDTTLKNAYKKSIEG